MRSICGLVGRRLSVGRRSGVSAVLGMRRVVVRNPSRLWFREGVRLHVLMAGRLGASEQRSGLLCWHAVSSRCFCYQGAWDSVRCWLLSPEILHV